jgi:hypothetical protein
MLAHFSGSSFTMHTSGVAFTRHERFMTHTLTSVNVTSQGDPWRTRRRLRDARGDD